MMRRYAEAWFLPLIAVLCSGCDTEVTETPRLQGAWSLEQYRMMRGDRSDVSGLLLMKDDRFGLIYTMRSEGGGLSGRGHAGRYSLHQDELIFDVEWWLEDVDGAAHAAAPAREAARTTHEDGTLVLHFGSGSVQRWRLIDGEADTAGAWQLQSLQADGAQRDVDGVLVLAEGRFTLIYSVEGSEGDADLYAYAGTSRGDGDDLTLTALWTVTFVEGDGHVSHAQRAMSLELRDTGLALLRGPGGEEFRLAR